MNITLSLASVRIRTSFGLRRRISNASEEHSATIFKSEANFTSLGNLKKKAEYSTETPDYNIVLSLETQNENWSHFFNRDLQGIFPQRTD
jgi:hypothetical protein